MRIRIKFTKNESVKYLGHLDIMRAFQRFFNCAGVKMSYSEGFNPHQKMHFALPLGVGIASTAEYLDAEIADGQDPAAIQKHLDEVSGTGFDILAVRALEDNAVKAMAAVRYALTEITFHQIPLPVQAGDVSEYFARDHVILTKTTKTGMREVDIISLLVQAELKERSLLLLMKTGGDSSIKPELIAADLFSFCHAEYSRDRISICRKELYGENLIPLIDYQTL